MPVCGAAPAELLGFGQYHVHTCVSVPPQWTGFFSTIALPASVLCDWCCPVRLQQSAFGNMMSALEAKYANGEVKGKKKKQQQPAAAAAAGGSGSKRKRGSKAAAAAAADGSDGGSDDSCVEDQGPEPTDAEFEAARAKLVQKAAKRKGHAAGADSSGSRSRKAQAAAGKGGDKAGRKAAGKKQKA